MARTKGWKRQAAACAVLAAFAIGAAVAQEVDHIAHQHARVLTDLILPPALEADADIGTAAKAARAAARAQIGGMATGWLRDEPPARDRPEREAQRRITARWLEAVARGAATMPLDEVESALREVAAIDSARYCAATDHASPVWPVWPVWTGDVVVRRASLAKVQGLLQRVGQSGAVPPIPDPDARTRMLQAASQAATDPANAALPLPSDLAELLPVVRRGVRPDDRSRFDCRVSHWWLRTLLTKPAAERQLDLEALRFHSIAAMAKAVARDADPMGPLYRGVPIGYPAVASLLGITGRTRVVVTLDDAGRPVAARVARRIVVVPGLPPERSVAFESVFDELALSNALGGNYEAHRRAMRADTQPATAQVEFAWKLRPD